VRLHRLRGHPNRAASAAPQLEVAPDVFPQDLLYVFLLNTRNGFQKHQRVFFCLHQHLLHLFVGDLLHFSLNDGAKAYEVFDKKMDNCIKAVLHP